MNYFKTTSGLTVIYADDEAVNFTREDPNYEELCNLAKQDNEEAFKALAIRVKTGAGRTEELRSALEEVGFELDTDNYTVKYKGFEVHGTIVSRIVDYKKRGMNNYKWLLSFQERLERNPSFRSREMLFDFLDRKNIPITEEGTFLAYKAVDANYKDKHSGTVDNSVGAEPTMPRNRISDDPNSTCSFGYHVGDLTYSGPNGWFTNRSDRIVIVEVDPENVVCVPVDHGQGKMRVCSYKVIGEYERPLSDDVHIDSDDYDDDECYDDDDSDYGW